MFEDLIAKVTAPLAAVFAVPAELHDEIQTAIADRLAYLEKWSLVSGLVSQ